MSVMGSPRKNEPSRRTGQRGSVTAQSTRAPWPPRRRAGPTRAPTYRSGTARGGAGRAHPSGAGPRTERRPPTIQEGQTGRPLRPQGLQGNLGRHIVIEKHQAASMPAHRVTGAPAVELRHGGRQLAIPATPRLRWTRSRARTRPEIRRRLSRPGHFVGDPSGTRPSRPHRPRNGWPRHDRPWLGGRRRVRVSHELRRSDRWAPNGPRMARPGHRSQ